MEHKQARAMLPAFVDNAFDAELADVATHLKGCSECRAELGTLSKITASLGELSDEPLTPPAWLEQSLVQAVRKGADEKVIALQPRHALAGGLVVAAGVTGALVLRSRRRRRIATTRRWRAALSA